MVSNSNENVYCNIFFENSTQFCHFNSFDFLSQKYKLNVDNILIINTKPENENCRIAIQRFSRYNCMPSREKLVAFLLSISAPCK